MTDGTPLKTCTMCGLAKSIDCYYRKGNCLHARCKDCHKADVLKRQASPDSMARRRALVASASEEQKAKYRDRRRAWKAANRESLSAKNRDYKKTRYPALLDQSRAALESPEASRTCSRCGQAKPAAAFHRSKYSVTGRVSACAECVSANRDAEAARKDYMASREQRIAVVRAWQRNNPDKVAATRAKRRLLEAETAIGDTDLEMLWTGYCSICGQPMDRDLRYPDPMSKSVDHIVPLSKGGPHRQSNLAMAHLACNKSKNDKMPTS